MTWKIIFYKMKGNKPIRKLTKKEILELIREYAKFNNANFLKTDYDKLVYYLDSFYNTWFIEIGEEKHNIGFGIVEKSKRVLYIDDEYNFNYGVMYIIQEGMFKGGCAYADKPLYDALNYKEECLTF